MQFLDQVKIFIKSGDGGAGCMSFRRERCIPFGGPDGGNGGRGADVLIRCVRGLNTLIDYRYQQHFRAKNGRPGSGRNRHGESAETLILKVPEGTQIFAEDGETLIADLVKAGDEYVLAKGGDGGRGNAEFKSSVNQAPRKHTLGWPGEELWVWMQLKLISDAGLIGLPNAGKSTFLAAVSAAKPKIADYPFTTLKPQLGVVSVDEHSFVLADIPGLIEGAHMGVGLGDAFLRHVERAGVLLHLIDATGEDPVSAYHTIRAELAAYSPKLAETEELIALSKADAVPADAMAAHQKALAQASGKQVFVLSAVSGEGMTAMLRALWAVLAQRQAHADKMAQEAATKAAPHLPLES
jgi:GTP-binding protein